MLPRINRIGDQSLFATVRNKGRAVEDRYLKIAYLKLEDNQPVKIGVVISSKVTAKAVERNLNKRVLLGLIRGILNQIKGGYVLIIIVKKPFLNLNKEQKEQILFNSLIKTEIMSA